MAKAKNLNSESDEIIKEVESNVVENATVEQPEQPEQVEEVEKTKLVKFKFNKNVNVGGTLVKAGGTLDIEPSYAEEFKALKVGDVVKVGE